MSFGSRIPAVAARLTGLALILWLAEGADALSLADLVVPGASFSAGRGTSYGEFAAKLQGKGLSHDLHDYQVVPTLEGFVLRAGARGERGGGRIHLGYRVAGSGLFRAQVEVDPHQGGGRLAVTEKLFAQGRIGSVQARTREGKAIDFATFDELGSLLVKEKIRLGGRDPLAWSGAPVTHSFHVRHPTPEPTTALMLASGLAALAATRRARAGRPPRARATAARVERGAAGAVRPARPPQRSA